eukprot:TRINITY_DN1612_c0_g1_i1.p2 TRINITY_DN1612_c0_g1~~TRINITY_DN1612_c0_g1_i1.p2  ORF type:complete len:196 (+),score=27.05 TRINITY_DN1612_c0_g1_i1:112-699(+)
MQRGLVGSEMCIRDSINAEYMGTSTNGVAIVGSTSSNTNGGSDAYVVCLDSNDNLLWAHNYGGINNEVAYSAHCSSNGNVIAVGDISTGGPSQGWAIIIDSNGNQIHEFIDSSPDYSSLKAAYYSSDGYSIVGGTYRSSSYKFYLIKLDSSGGKVWEKAYLDSSTDDYIYGIVLGSNSNIFACGSQGSTFFCYHE